MATERVGPMARESIKAERQPLPVTHRRRGACVPEHVRCLGTSFTSGAALRTVGGAGGKRRRAGGGRRAERRDWLRAGTSERIRDANQGGKGA